MRTKEYKVDFCVVGGGLAGLCAAIAAARHGIRTLLMQDRPVLGGNASEEIRMWVCGAHGRDNREGGLLEELELDNYYYNPGLKYPLWDGVLYQKAMAETNLTLLLNTSCLQAETDGARICSVTGWQSNAETWHRVEAAFFADCSGDSILAPLTGAHFRYGRESRAEFGETIPPEQADRKTMGMSCLFQIRQTDSPKPFIPPPSANVYPTDADLPFKDHTLDNNFWWIELGGEDDCIHDTDKCREELLKIVYGVWDHMKNRGDHGAQNWELEWVGFLPGKRESRRYVGDVTVTQTDVEAGGPFPDAVAYAGWSMDDHFPQGFRYNKGHPTIYHPAPSPWCIPFRALYSVNIENLLFAGRNISVTHAALSSCRVMGTCALLGQAVGCAAAQMVQTGTTPRTLDIPALQRTLALEDCGIPGRAREPGRAAMAARMSHPVLRDGFERGEEHLFIGPEGSRVGCTFAAPVPIAGVRLVFDSDFNRGYHNMPCRYLLHETGYRLPDTLVREFDLTYVFADGTEQTVTYENHLRLRMLPAPEKAGEGVRAVWATLRGARCGEARLFAFEVLDA